MLFCGLSFHAQSQQICSQNKVDKSFQEILYFYFQRDFYQALTKIDLLESSCANGFEMVSNPGVDPLLLKGGISLAYGLEEQAADIFDLVLQQAADQKTQTQAWLLLGKALFQKQDYQLASSALANISLDTADDYLDPLDKDEWIYMQSQLYTVNNTDIEQSANQPHDNSYWLESLTDNSIYRQYVTYNKGLAQLQDGQYEAALSTLGTVGKESSSFLPDVFGGWFGPLRADNSEELAALRDRANLTLGYAHLKNQQTLLSIEAFKRVRLDSIDTDSALLGYGWASAQREEFQVAVSVWKQLQQMPYRNEFVMESFLASAFAYEQAFAPTQAIANLNLGLQRYAQEVSFLNRSKQQVDDQFFLELGKNASWADSIPEHLSDIMLSNEFRSQLNWLTESIEIEHSLQQWQTRLDAYDLMLDERKQENSVRVENLKNNRTLDKLPNLIAARDQLQDKLEQAKTNPLLLADEQELAWLERLDGAITRHQQIVEKKKQLSQAPLKDAYLQRLERLQSILTWNASEQSSKRAWQSKKALSELDQMIIKTSAQQSLLQSALNRPPEYENQRNRISVLRTKLSEKLQTNQQAKELLLISLRKSFADKLNEQLDQLQSYQIQAQLAIVRLNDKAYRNALADEQQGSRE